MEKTKRVFISYSWSNSDHESWVISLAERLMSDGVDVTIDKWDLKEGHNKYKFMETMVTSKDIDRVLIILDKVYKEKADKGDGGVGSEAQIISPEVYSNVAQEKFIPIIAQRDGDGSEYVPVFLKGRIYIDLSLSDKFEDNYEMLLRNIFSRPAHIKPQLGSPPRHLFVETPMTYKTSLMLRSLDNTLNKHPQRVNSVLRDFLNTFYNDLKGFTIAFSANDSVTIGKEICENINLYTPLRNDFLEFLDKLLKSDLPFDNDIIIRFLEQLPQLESPLETRGGSLSNYEFDNFRLMTHELFIYLITLGLKHENFKFIEDLVYTRYLFQGNNYRNDGPAGFEELYRNVESIKSYYNSTYSANYISPMADFMIKRIPELISKDLFIQADLLCHYIGVYNGNTWSWFPLTYIYKNNNRFEIFDRLVSKKHFLKIKGLFNVETSEDFVKRLEEIKKSSENDPHNGRIRFSNFRDSVIPIYQMIKIDSIAISR